MPNKKRIFTKDNSVKFLLLQGNSQALNADGEKLENVLVPIGKNYKAGTSLLMSKFADICSKEVPGNEVPGNSEKDADLKNIMDQFADTDSDIVSLESGMEHLSANNKRNRCDILVEECSDDDNSDYYDVDSQFSDADDFFKEEVQHSIQDAYKDCPENVKIFNERFEKVLGEYDEEQIGALDDEEICGNLSTDCERVQNLFESELNREEEIIVLGPCDEIMKEKILNLAEDTTEEKLVEIVFEKPLEWDCESILSTYSNKYNHPTVIKEVSTKKMRIPRNPLKTGLTKSQLRALDYENKNESDSESDDNLSVASKFNVRVKGETPEEKRERKSFFKEAKKESRMLKKENKLAFKREKKVQTALSLNVQRTQGIKLL